MIKRLRKKFILINMLLVTLVLLIVFGVMFVGNVRRMTRESSDALHRALNMSDKKQPPEGPEGGAADKRPEADRQQKRPLSILPVFCVTVDESGKIAEFNTIQTTAVTEEDAQKAADQALKQVKSSGILKEEGLRYLKEENGKETKIAFSDYAREQAAIVSQVQSTLLVGGLGLLAFFFISLFLSRWALRPAERAWEQQRQFVADASHELKTPLTVILANTQILKSHPEDQISQRMTWVDNTKEEAEQMKKLVEDMLFLAKTDSTPDRLRTELEFSDLVQNCSLIFEAVAFENGVSMETEIRPGIKVCGDSGQMKRLLLILLDNACKYAGKDGKITITLEKLADVAQLIVTNTGEPIPAEALPHIFDRFYRADKSRSRSMGGFGLGLSIAERIVKLHHGKIRVVSNEADGTAFIVELKTGRRHIPE